MMSTKENFPKESKWYIQNIKLDQDIPGLSVQHEYSGLFVVFWTDDIPVGYQEFSNDALPISAAELREIALDIASRTVESHHLKQGFLPPALKAKGLLAKLPPPIWNLNALRTLEAPLTNLAQIYNNTEFPNKNDSVSVIICTRDRPQQLKTCLESLQRLHDHPNEIIVVDNAPTNSATRSVVANFPNIHYVLETRPGLSIARNTGIRHATSNLIAYTDDDVEVHPSWIKQIRYGFQDPKVMVVTGLMLPALLETAAQVAFHQSTSGFDWACHPIIYDAQYFADRCPFGTPVWQIGAGANMALRRQVIDSIGGFHELLGAGASGCSEDSEFWYRVLAAGWSCRYEPSAVVYHHHRGDLQGLKKQQYAYMRGHVMALLIQACQHQHWGNLFRLLVILPEYYIGVILRELFALPKGKQIVQRRKTVFVEIMGCLAGVLFFIRHYATASDPRSVRL